MGAVERTVELIRKEFRQIFRDPRLRMIIFVAPVIQLVVFGYAVSTDIRNTTTFIVDHDQTATSRALVEALTSSGYFQIVGRSDRPTDLSRALDRGDAVVGLQIPAGFSSDLAAGRGARVQVLLDGTNSNIATVARGYVERIVQAFALDTVRVRPPGLVDLRERAWFNPDLDSRDYNVPAVVGAIILLVALLLTSLAIVREREMGTLEQLMVSPLRPIELIAGKTIPFAIIGLIDLGIVFGIALLWFGIPFEGSVWLLLLASVLYLLSALGIGLFISTISRTQQEAFMASFLIFMPTILLSGFMFPVSSMPEIFQWLTLLNPTRHYLEIVRG
ncbi:MAG: ABC transporter permease, partial [Acidobacteria bacterium]|nr:ABC transporter permease [Acidobacteriota bacterium]